MTYYLLLEDKEQDAIPLGEESFGAFYPDEGMEVLGRILDTAPEAVEKIQIITEKNQKLSLTEFFDFLSTLTIKRI